MGDLKSNSELPEYFEQMDLESNPKLPSPGDLGADVFDPRCDVCPDEYGTATETKAVEENCSPQEICDSFDEVGRTSSPRRTEMSISGERLSEDTMEQRRCNAYERPLAVGLERVSLSFPVFNDPELLNPTDSKDRKCEVFNKGTELFLIAALTGDQKWGVPVPHGKYKDKVSTTECYDVKAYTVNSVPLPSPPPTVNAFSWKHGLP